MTTVHRTTRYQSYFKVIFSLPDGGLGLFYAGSVRIVGNKIKMKHMNDGTTRSIHVVDYKSMTREICINDNN